MACTESDLGPLAKLAYGCLKDQFKSYSTFWKLGHSFDTIIDYFLLGSDYNADAQDFGYLACAAYLRSANNACWYDDSGWWGIAALRASQYPELFGANIDAFPYISMCCWRTMDDCGPNVWKNNWTNSKYKNLEPRFPGGVWNWDWTEPLPESCGDLQTAPNFPPDCSDDSQSGNLGGIQNTVTNGLYLVLASRLGQWEAANREYGFLDAWFSVAGSDQSLLMNVDGGALVRERVGTYGAQDQDGKGFLHVCGYKSELAWAGDQGLILGGLVEMLNPNNPSPASDYLERAKSIAAGVKSKSDGTMKAWVSGEGGDPTDYNTGVGVYMRYLLYAYLNNPQMKSYLRDTGYVDFVCENASEITEGKINTDNEPRPNHDPVVDLTNDLAILVAAIQMTRQ